MRTPALLMMSILLLAVSVTPAQPPAETRIFRAGAATANITPPLGSPIVGGWAPMPATYVHDELHTRALVLDDGTMRLAIVVSDNVGIPRAVLDEAKRIVSSKTGLPQQNMLMSSSHTHSAASAEGKGRVFAEQDLNDYQKFVANRISDAVLCAIHNLEPARIGFGRGREASQVFNRRWKVKPGVVLRSPFGGIDQAMMNPKPGDPNLLEPAGPTDPEICFLSVQSASGRPLALLANYSLHYVGGVRGADISADYYGIFAERIAEFIGAKGQEPPFVGMMSNGTSGNINNINFFGTDTRKWQPYEKMRFVASLVAAEVFKEYQRIEYQNWVPLGAAVRELPLSVRLPEPKDVAWAESVLKNPPKIHIREEIYARRTLAMREYPKQIPLILQALRIGDIGISAIPNEVFVEIGLELKQRNPFPKSFTVSLANGSYGYLPTVEQHKLGGYETWRGTNILEIEAATKIVDILLGLLSDLKVRP